MAEVETCILAGGLSSHRFPRASESAPPSDDVPTRHWPSATSHSHSSTTKLPAKEHHSFE